MLPLELKDYDKSNLVLHVVVFFISRFCNFVSCHFVRKFCSKQIYSPSLSFTISATKSIAGLVLFIHAIYVR